MSRRPATLLAFDYGETKMGVAVGQTLTDTANPLGTVTMRGSAPDWTAIEEMIRTWEPDALVVGVPVHMDGTEQPMTHAARRFMSQLERRFGLPVHGSDERLSTQEAKQRLAAAGQSPESHDSVAAQVILEGWLAANQS